jgi:hypothetical protein
MPLPSIETCRRKLAELQPGEGGYLLRAWLLAPWVEASLALVGVKRTFEMVDGLAARAAGSAVPVRSALRDADPRDVARARQLVDWAYRLHVLRGECLPRSLLQYGLMRSDGANVRFVLGVAKRASDGAQPVHGHAWVEGGARDGVTVEREVFTRVWEPPASTGVWRDAPQSRSAR